MWQTKGDRTVHSRIGSFIRRWGNGRRTRAKGASPPTEARPLAEEKGAAEKRPDAFPEAAKAGYKMVPESWKALPPQRLEKAISHLEAVLLDITTTADLSENPFDWKPTLPTLEKWVEHLRHALRELTREK
jgi:hypothetical protein